MSCSLTCPACAFPVIERVLRVYENRVLIGRLFAWEARIRSLSR